MKWVKLKAIKMSVGCKRVHEHVNLYVLTCGEPGLSIVSLLESSWVWAAAGCSCTGLLTNDCWVELDMLHWFVAMCWLQHLV